MTPKQFRDECLRQVDYYLERAPYAYVKPVEKVKIRSRLGGTVEVWPPARPEFEKRAIIAGTVCIEVGGTTYTILNTKDKLAEFKRRLSKLPLSDRDSTAHQLRLPAPGKGGRVTRGLDGRYYEEGYRPEKHPLKLNKTTARDWGVCGGWAMCQAMCIDTPVTGETPLHKCPDTLPSQLQEIVSGNTTLYPSTIVATYYDDSIPHPVVLVRADETELTYRADWLDIVHTAFPGHVAALAQGLGNMWFYVAVDSGRVVAIVVSTDKYDVINPRRESN